MCNTQFVNYVIQCLDFIGSVIFAFFPRAVHSGCHWSLRRRYLYRLYAFSSKEDSVARNVRWRWMARRKLWISTQKTPIRCNLSSSQKRCPVSRKCE